MSDGGERVDQPEDAVWHGDERAGRPRRLPALALILVLAAVAAYVWTDVLTDEGTATSRVAAHSHRGPRR